MHGNQHELLSEILETVPDGTVENIVVGKHWTAVSLFVGDTRLCGLASTIQDEKTMLNGHVNAFSGQSNPISAKLLSLRLALGNPILSSISAAALNGLLQYNFLTDLLERKLPFGVMECNAEELIVQHGQGRRIAVIGHFPFVDRIRPIADRLDVLEFQPQPGDLPAEAASDVLPKADVVAITGMTWINGTLQKLLSWCSPSATVILLGASTPLSPVLFSHGVDYLSGAIVKNIDPVMQAVADGEVYRKIIPAGLQLVTIHLSAFNPKEKTLP